MPQLKSTTGGRDVFVDDADPSWQKMVDSGAYKVADGDTASIVDPYGHQTVVGTDVVQRDQAAGVADKIEDQGTVVKRAREKRLESQTSTLGAGARGVASGLSFGLTDQLADDETIEADELHHGTARMVGEVAAIGGSLLLGNDLGLMKLFGEGEAAARAATGARELAIAGDALTAEQVGASLSTSAMLSGKGTSAAERALGRSGRALDEGTIARSGLTDIPDDLIGLDAKGLRTAALEEKAALRAQAEAEKGALEGALVPLRKQIADEVLAMHAELKAERNVSSVVTGKGGIYSELKGIEGIRDVNSQIVGSFNNLNKAYANPIAIAENPDRLIGHLQMRQAGLEGLQKLEPQIRAAMPGDARLAGLDHVGDALTQTREQISTLQALSKANPVNSERLTNLSAGVSPRLNAIEAAQEAIKTAPEVGLAQKGMQAGAFAGVTALAHAIPGVGIMAPFAGKWASDAIGKTFEHLAAGKAAVANRTKAALDAFLSVGKNVTPAAAGLAAARTATQVLSSARFAPSSEDAAESKGGKPLVNAYKARSAEIRSQTMYDQTGTVVIRPEARQAIAQRLASVGAVNPLLADKLETQAVRNAEYISSTLPRQPDVGGLQIGPNNWQPSDLAMRSWARTVRAVEDPGSVEEDLAHGILTPEAARAYRACYPERFLAMQSAIYTAAPTLSKTLPMRKKIALSIFSGVPLTPALMPNVLQVLQSTFAVEPGTAGGSQAPKPQPAFTAFGSTPSKDKTAAQRSEEP